MALREQLFVLWTRKELEAPPHGPSHRHLPARELRPEHPEAAYHQTAGSQLLQGGFRPRSASKPNEVDMEEDKLPMAESFVRGHPKLEECMVRLLDSGCQPDYSIAQIRRYSLCVCVCYVCSVVYDSLCFTAGSSLSKHQTDQIQPKMLSKQVLRLLEKFNIDPALDAYYLLDVYSALSQDPACFELPQDRFRRRRGCHEDSVAPSSPQRPTPTLGPEKSPQPGEESQGSQVPPWPHSSCVWRRLLGTNRTDRAEREPRHSEERRAERRMGEKEMDLEQSK
ncbi:unnamed protein product, partial [Coregonus sp. 'balchen']